MKILLASGVAIVGLAGCGAGVSDTTYPILGGYVFSDAGGPEKTIIYQGDGAQKGTVIDGRVDRYRIVGNRIVVARRPEVQSDGASGPITTKLSDGCEHWVINTGTHVVARVDEKSPDALLACNSPYDEEFNPRL
jgi:hypothetical protein